MANLKDLIVNGSSRILGNGYISGNLSILNYLESYNGIHFLNSSNTIIGKITSDDTYGTVLQYGSNYINIKSNGLYWNNTTKISLDGHTHTSVKDISNGTTTTFAYSKEGLSSATWIAGWNNYELRAISPSNIKAGSAKVADSVAWGNVSGKPTTFTPSSHDHTNASQSADGFMSLADKKKLDGIEAGANKFTYTLPAATADKLGGVKIGNNITNSSGLISLTKANVTAALGYTPPTTNTNTTYSLSGGNGTANVTLTPSSGTPTTITINNVANATSAGTCTGNAKTSSSCTGNAATATTANKLVTSADKGSGTNPVYFKNGVPVACSYTLGQSVTSSSKLTDTTYSLSGTNTNKVTLTASSGGTSSVIVNNVAYATSAGSANSVAWDNVSGKPGSYTPSSHGHSNATTSADGFMSMGDKTKLNKYANAFYGTHDGSKFYKIEILSTATWMLAFTIRVYQGYRYTDVVVSGYQYGKNFWYSPSAIILGDSAKSSLEVYFGHDDVNHLWVGIEGGSYTGIGIFNVTNGYTQVASVDELFKIVPLADICKTVDIKITAYAPWYRNETVSNATTASKLPDTVDVGSKTQPVYFLNGSPKLCSYKLEKSVPSDAKFTDTNTTYSISGNGTANVTLTPSSGTPTTITINNVANATSAGTCTGNAATATSAGTCTGNAKTSSSCTGNSATASKLVSSTDKGSATQPIYFKNGVPVVCSYTLGQSVTSSSKLTDTTYKLGGSGTNTVKLYANGSTTAQDSIIVNNVAYATKSGSTDSVAWDNVSGKPTTFTPSSHDHTNASTTADGFMSLADKKKLDGIEAGANKFTYTLPAATADKLGGVKIGSNITVSSGTISLTKSNVTTALGYTPPTTNTNTTYKIDGDGTNTVKLYANGSSTAQNSVTINNVSHADTARSATTAGSCTGNAATATTANKLATSTDKGSGTNPVYFKNGVPVACSYTLGKSVTSSSKLTDTTYSLSGGNGTANVTLTPSSGTPTTITINNVANAGTAGSVAWGNVSGKPTTFTPATHGHSNATTGAAGFMSADDKSKIDNVVTLEPDNFGENLILCDANGNGMVFYEHDAYNRPEPNGISFIRRFRDPIKNTSLNFQIDQKLGDEYFYFESKLDNINSGETIKHDIIYDMVDGEMFSDGYLVINERNKDNFLYPPATHGHNNATTGAAGFMSASDKVKLNGIETGANKYTLPIATASKLGGIKIGSGLSINSSTGVVSVTSVTPGAHTHAISDITNLASELAGKSDIGHNHNASYSAKGHTHTASEVGAIPSTTNFNVRTEGVQILEAKTIKIKNSPADKYDTEDGIRFKRSDDKFVDILKSKDGRLYYSNRVDTFATTQTESYQPYHHEIIHTGMVQGTNWKNYLNPDASEYGTFLDKFDWLWHGKDKTHYFNGGSGCGFLNFYTRIHINNVHGKVFNLTKIFDYMTSNQGLNSNDPNRACHFDHPEFEIKFYGTFYGGLKIEKINNESTKYTFEYDGKKYDSTFFSFNPGFRERRDTSSITKVLSLDEAILKHYHYMDAIDEISFCLHIKSSGDYFYKNSNKETMVIWLEIF